VRAWLWVWIAGCVAPPPSSSGSIDDGALDGDPSTLTDSDRGETDGEAPGPRETDAEADTDALPGEPAWDPSLSAVLGRDDGKIFFFRGPDYLRYDWAADAADAGYPRETDPWWLGVGANPLDAAAQRDDGLAWMFRGDVAMTYDWSLDAVAATASIATALPGVAWDHVDAAARLPTDDGVVLFQGGQLLRWTPAAGVQPGDPRAITEVWSDISNDPIDAAFTIANRIYVFRGDDYWRVELSDGSVPSSYPRDRTYWWPGLWDEHEGTGHPTGLVPAAILAALHAKPSQAEIDARRARVAASAGSTYVDLTPQYPQYVASLEDRMQHWGCGLLKRTDSAVYRFRCATDQAGPLRLDIPELRVDHVDWSHAAHHSQQVSQGDFMADLGTPISVFESDDGTFEIVGIYSNNPTGSISGGLNIRVGLWLDGTWREIGWSHLNPHVPGYVLDALANDTPLPNGTVFGFIGATGNLWTGTPPATDQPYAGTGAGLPAPHSHVWFKDSLGDHEALTVRTRQVIDYSGRYPYGGG